MVWAVTGNIKGPAGSPYDRTTTTVTTLSLAPGTSGQLAPVLGASWRLLYVETTRAARLRFYVATSKVAADAARSFMVAPSGDHGVLCEVITGLSLGVHITPAVDGFQLPAQQEAVLVVDNLDTVAGSVTVTLTWQRVE